MSGHSPDYDVFLSHSLKAKAPAALVAEQFREAGLSVFSIWEQASAGEGIAEQAWEALVESAALVLVIPAGAGPASSLALDVGAARARGTPIYVLAEDGAGFSVPVYLRHAKVFPMSRLPEVIDEVARASKPLRDEDRAVLAKVYSELGLPVEHILTRPGAMDQLASDFRSRSGHRVPSAKLARELLRLHKAGRLRPPRTRQHA